MLTQDLDVWNIVGPCGGVLCDVKAVTATTDNRIYLSLPDLRELHKVYTRWEDTPAGRMGKRAGREQEWQAEREAQREAERGVEKANRAATYASRAAGAGAGEAPPPVEGLRYMISLDPIVSTNVDVRYNGNVIGYIQVDRHGPDCVFLHGMGATSTVSYTHNGIAADWIAAGRPGAVVQQPVRLSIKEGANAVRRWGATLRAMEKKDFKESKEGANHTEFLKNKREDKKKAATPEAKKELADRQEVDKAARAIKKMERGVVKERAKFDDEQVVFNEKLRLDEQGHSWAKVVKNDEKDSAEMRWDAKEDNDKLDIWGHKLAFREEKLAFEKEKYEYLYLDMQLKARKKGFEEQKKVHYTWISQNDICFREKKNAFEEETAYP